MACVEGLASSCGELGKTQVHEVASTVSLFVLSEADNLISHSFLARGKSCLSANMNFGFKKANTAGTDVLLDELAHRLGPGGARREVPAVRCMQVSQAAPGVCWEELRASQLEGTVLSWHL